eukprot:1638807-Pyramimonas_sp.AAC.1
MAEALRHSAQIFSYPFFLVPPPLPRLPSLVLRLRWIAVPQGLQSVFRDLAFEACIVACVTLELPGRPVVTLT